MNDTTLIRFHEDSYCMIELLPRASSDFARQHARAAHDFGKAHAAPGGIGWTDVYVIPSAPATFESLGIRQDDLAKHIPAGMSYFDRVTEGYDPDARPAASTVAWGRKGGLIFADFNSERIVKHAWLEHFGAAEVNDVAAFFAACSKTWELILADWYWHQVVDLRDEAEVQSYLQLRRRAD